MMAAGLGGLGVNVAGLPGIGEESMMWKSWLLGFLYESIATYGNLASTPLSYNEILWRTFLLHKICIGRSLLYNITSDDYTRIERLPFTGHICSPGIELAKLFFFRRTARRIHTLKVSAWLFFLPFSSVTCCWKAAWMWHGAMGALVFIDSSHLLLWCTYLLLYICVAGGETGKSFRIHWWKASYSNMARGRAEQEQWEQNLQYIARRSNGKAILVLFVYHYID